MAEKQFNKGDVIFREGEYGTTMYRILDGAVSIYANYGESGEQKLTELKAGDFFGEMAVIEAFPRSATAVAACEARVDEVGKESLSEYFKAEPDMIMKIMRHISGRLRELTHDYREVCATIAEMEPGGAKKPRSEGLVAKIKKFAGVYLGSRGKAEVSYEAQREQRQSEKGLDKRMETLSKGTVIFRQGETGKCMYDLHWGSVGIYSGYGTEYEKLLTEIQPNEFFGEMGMIEGEPRSATAVVTESGSVLETIYEEDLAELFAVNPAKVFMVLSHLSNRLRKLTVDYLNACKLVYVVSDAEETEQPVSEEVKAEANRYARVRVNGYDVFL